MTGAARRQANAISARRTLVLAAAGSLALHGAVLAGAHWLWGRAAAPTAAPMRAIAMVVAAAERPAPGRPRTAPKDAVPDATTPALAEPARSPPRPARKPPAPEPRPEAVSAQPSRPDPVQARPQARPIAPAPPAQLARLRPPQRPKPPTPDPRETGPVVHKAPPPAAPAAASPAPAARTEVPAPSGRDGAPSPQVAAVPVTPPRAGIEGLANPAPAYPWLARRRGEEGRVVLTVTVGADGRPSTIAVKHSSGHERLDDAAMRAVERWRFAPARRAGRVVAGEIDVPISFRLTD